MVPRPGRDHEKCWLGKHHRPLPPSREALRYATNNKPRGAGPACWTATTRITLANAESTWPRRC